MNKLTNFILIVSGLTLVFWLFGLIDNSPNSVLLSILINPANFQISNLFVVVVLAIEGATSLTAIAIGYFTNRIDLAVMVPVTIFIGNFFFDAIQIYNVVAQASPVLALLLFSPLMILFAITLIDWWRGND